MATDQRSLPAFFNVDADFRTWAQGIHNQLAAVGLVNTSDTGQINLTTVTKPAAVNTAQGYEIWRFADTLQATAPIFIKIEYGSGGVNIDRPSIWITPGSATNGAGTLSGQLGQRRQFAAGTSKSAGITLPSDCCSDGSGVVLMNNFDSANTGFVFGFAIDRTRDGAGAATSDGFFFWGSSLGTVSAAFWQIIPNTGGVLTGSTQTGTTSGWTFSPAIAGASFGQNNYGSNTAVAPYMGVVGKLLFSKMLHAVLQSALSINSPTVFTTLGGSHTYLPFSSAGVYTITGNNGDAVCVLWE